MDAHHFYETFIAPHQGIIHRICFAYARDADDLQDFKQEVALQLWRSNQNFQGASKTSTWVYRVALNTCLTLTNKADRKIATTSIDGEAYRLSDDQEGAKKRELQHHLYTAIKKLPPGERAIIMLFLEEKSYKEMADILGISVSHVGVKLNRIKASLKKLMSHV